MSNANKAKGDRWERPVLKYLQEAFGRAAIRPRQEGYIDVGDVHISPFALQLKDEAKHDFSGYVNDAEKQAKAAGEPFGAAVVKRRKYATDKGYVVMTLGTFRDVLVRLRRAEELLARHAPEVFHTEHLPSEQPEDASQTSPAPQTENEPESE